MVCCCMQSGHDSIVTVRAGQTYSDHIFSNECDFHELFDLSCHELIYSQSSGTMIVKLCGTLELAFKDYKSACAKNHCF